MIKLLLVEDLALVAPLAAAFDPLDLAGHGSLLLRSLLTMEKKGWMPGKSINRTLS